MTVYFLTMVLFVDVIAKTGVATKLREQDMRFVHTICGKGFRVRLPIFQNLRRHQADGFVVVVV